MCAHTPVQTGPVQHIDVVGAAEGTGVSRLGLDDQRCSGARSVRRLCHGGAWEMTAASKICDQNLRVCRVDASLVRGSGVEGPGEGTQHTLQMTQGRTVLTKCTYSSYLQFSIYREYEEHESVAEARVRTTHADPPASSSSFLLSYNACVAQHIERRLLSECN